MEEYNTRNLLSKLPPRCDEGNGNGNKDRNGGKVVNATIDYSNTVVEAFTRDSVERVQDMLEANEDVFSVMAQLHAAAVSFPVRICDLKRVKLPAALRREKRVYAKLLQVLNGPGTSLVTPQQLAVAAARERAIAKHDFGWGSAEAITNYSGYISKLLLQSVGVDVDVLPKVKSVPASIRAQIDDAWGKACFYYSWT